MYKCSLFHFNGVIANVWHFEAGSVVASIERGDDIVRDLLRKTENYGDVWTEAPADNPTSAGTIVQRWAIDNGEYFELWVPLSR